MKMRKIRDFTKAKIIKRKEVSKYIYSLWGRLYAKF